jgi:hypothetical protein
MDLTQDIIYRSFTLNDSNLESNLTSGGATGSGISGCAVDSADFSDVDVVQFIEKRSQQDGMDAGDVFLGARRLRMAGTLYATTRALLYDQLAALRAALSPVLAQREEPLDRGYRPLYFSVPTNDATNWPLGAIPQRVLALPRAFQAIFNRDQLGGDDGDALAIPWQATFMCKDPTIQGASPQDYSLANAATNAGNLTNRGNYIAPLDMLIEVTSASGSISATIGDSVFTITVPSSTGNRIIRFKGEDKVLTVEEDSVEVTRMDLLSFSGSTTWPFIDPGTAAYSITKSGVTIVAGSHFWFYERYA